MKQAAEAKPKKASTKPRPLELAMQVLNADPRPLASEGEHIYQFMDDGRGWVRVTHALRRDIMMRLGEVVPNIMTPILDTFHVPEYPGIYWQWTPGASYFEGRWVPLHLKPTQLVFQDAIVDMTGRTEPHYYDCQTTPIWGPIITMNFSDLSGDCDKEFTDVLDRFIDPNHRPYFQEALSCVLAPHNPFKWLVFLIGPSNSGKSTVVAAVSTAPAGQGGQTSVDPDQAATRPFSSAHMHGKHCVVVEEFESVGKNGRRWTKTLTGGRLLSEMKYESASDHVPTAKILATSNYIPSFDDDSEAIQNRLVVLPMQRTISIDECYPPMVATSYWASGWRRRAVLSWLVQGYARLVSRAFYLHIPDDVKEIAKRIRIESHTTLRALRDKFEFTGDVTRDRLTTDEIRQVLQAEGVRDFRNLKRLVMEAFPGISEERRCKRTAAGSYDFGRGFQGIRRVE